MIGKVFRKTIHDHIIILGQKLRPLFNQASHGLLRQIGFSRRFIAAIIPARGLLVKKREKYEDFGPSIKNLQSASISFLINFWPVTSSKVFQVIASDAPKTRFSLFCFFSLLGFGPTRYHNCISRVGLGEKLI